MPVLTAIFCDLLACDAWPSLSERRRESVSGGKSPPSRLMASWILVSLVSRASAAQRVGVEVAMIKMCKVRERKWERWRIGLVGVEMRRGMEERLVEVKVPVDFLRTHRGRSRG